MKTILLLCFLVLYNGSVLFARTNGIYKYSIMIWDYNYSMAYTTFYHLKNDSLLVKHIGGIQNEGEILLLKKNLLETECQSLRDFLNRFDVDSLKDEYINSSIEDGNVKKIVVQVNDKVKTIIVENFYQRDLGALFFAINKLLPINLQIIYEKPSYTN